MQQKLLKLLQDRSEEICRRWIEDLRETGTMNLDSNEEYKKVTSTLYGSILEGLETGDYRGIFEKVGESLPENISQQFNFQALTLLKSIVEDVLSAEYKDLPPFAIDRLAETSKIWDRAIEKCETYTLKKSPVSSPSLEEEKKNPVEEEEKEKLTLVEEKKNLVEVSHPNEQSSGFKNQDIVESIPLGIVVIDRNGIIKGFNSSQEKISEVEKKEVLGKQFFRMFPPGIKLLENVFKKGEPFIIENFKYIKEENKEIVIDLKIYPLKNSQEKIIGATVITEDVTERREAREEVIHSEKILSAGELATSVAHGIGNPLSIISGNIQLLLNKIDKNDLREKELKLIQKEVERCSKIVEALLEYSRLSKYRGKPINISKLIEEHSQW